MKGKSTNLLFFLIILFSLLFVIFFVPLHMPFSGEKDSQIVSYLAFGNVEKLDGCSEEEISHMEDVRLLVFVALTLFLVLSFVFYKNIDVDYKSLIKKLLWFDGIVLFCLIFFNWFFRLFHLILFPQGNYLFAENSLLIQTYPQSFFIWMFVFFVVLVNIISTLTYRKKKNKH